MTIPDYAVVITLNNEQRPRTDVRVRKAALLAIDRQEAIDVLTQGYGEPGSNMHGKRGILIGSARQAWQQLLASN